MQRKRNRNRHRNVTQSKQMDRNVANIMCTHVYSRVLGSSNIESRPKPALGSGGYSRVLTGTHGCLPTYLEPLCLERLAQLGDREQRRGRFGGIL